MTLEPHEMEMGHGKMSRGGHGEMPQKGHDHGQHVMKPVSQMSFWEKKKLKIIMTMSMGVEHGGLTGPEMAKLMEEDIRNKFFFASALLMNISSIIVTPNAVLLQRAEKDLISI